MKDENQMSFFEVENFWQNEWKGNFLLSNWQHGK